MLTSYGATRVFDYWDEDVVEQIRKAAPNGKIDVVLDCVGDEGHTIKPISKVVGARSRVGILLPVRAGGYGGTTGVFLETKTEFPAGVKIVVVRTFVYEEERQKLLGF